MSHAVSRRIAVIAFSPLEEEFFAAGDQMGDSSTDDFSDLDVGRQVRSIWRQLWSWLRPSQRCASE